MICARCRSWNFRDYRFCRECGGKLDPSVDSTADSADPRVEELLHQAFTALDQGELDNALNKVQEALALQPGSAPAHSALGAIYERRGMIPEAIQQTEMALQLNPDCTADREKLERLRRQALPPSRSLATSRTQIAGAAAVIAATLVFGIGAAVMLRPQPAPHSGNTTRTNNNTAGATSSRGRVAAASGPAAAWGVTPPGAAAAKPTGAPPPNALTAVPVTSSPVSSPSLSAMPGPAWGTAQGVTTPVAGTSGASQTFAGRASEPLAPAPVGQVAPLEPTVAEAAPAPPVGSSPSPAPGFPATEPSEPEAGFIQIEAGAGPKRDGGTPGAVANPNREAATPSTPPRIEISIGRGGGGNSVAPQGFSGGGSPLSGAKQTERQAFTAFRRGDHSEAARLFRQAERQYGGITARGGNESGQAAEGLETSRQMLGKLRR